MSRLRPGGSRLRPGGRYAGARGGPVAVLLAVVASSVLAGCGGGSAVQGRSGNVPAETTPSGLVTTTGDGTASDPAAPAPAPTGGGLMPGLKSLLPGPERTTAVGRAPSPSASRTSVESQAVFSTPSKNIACAMEPSFTRCDISERSWSAPPKPASCELDYGNGLAINAGTAGITCAGDTVLGAPRILPYGQAVRVGTVACTSSAAGVRCADQATGHGFLLAKESYQVF